MIAGIALALCALFVTYSLGGMFQGLQDCEELSHLETLHRAADAHRRCVTDALAHHWTMLQAGRELADQV